MSIHWKWLRAVRAPRGTPGNARVRRLLVLGLIAAIAILETGCQSGAGCGSCRSCGWFQRTRSRIFNRPSRAYESPVIGDSAVEISGPATVVSPSTTGGPLSAPVGGGSIPSTVVPPAGGSPPIDLEPAPTARPGTSSTSGSGAGRTSYLGRPSTTRTAVRIDSGLTPDRASLHRSKPGPSSDGPPSPAEADEDNPLDHLPPLDLPGEVTKSADNPPATRPEGKSSVSTVEGGEARSAVDRPENGVRLLATEAVSDPEPAPAPAPGGRNGMARFTSVAPKLAGGSVPTSEGLAWLAEKGYRTVLDLRPSTEVSATFLAEVASRGLRYLAMPVDLDRIDADRLGRFQFELAAPEARPLYFFDTDGSRAGALWYIRRVSVDHVDPQIARREAEEIGLRTPAAWNAVTALLDSIQTEQAHPARTAADVPPTTPPASAVAPELSKKPAHPDAEGASASKVPSPPVLTSASSVESSGSIYPPLLPPSYTYNNPPPIGTPLPALPATSRPTWRPIAAMLLTGLSLPLVYWSRSVFPEAIARVRASLPAPGPRSKSLPPGSGA